MQQLGTTPPPVDGARLRQPSRRGVPSVRPALIVVGIAAGVVLLFGIAAALTGGSGPAAVHRPAASVHGTSVRAKAAAKVLEPIEDPGTPPTDILRSLVVPAGSKTLSSTPWDGATQYSGEMRFSLAASQAAVIGFYEAELKSLGWSISSTGAAHDQPRATEVLAQRASDDSWYWEVGVVVSPTTFGAAGGDTTRFTLDLFEVPDAQ